MSVGSIGANQSVFLLGKERPVQFLQRYQQLLDALAGQGEFIDPCHHPEWLACYEQDSQPLHTRLPILVFKPFTVQAIAPFIQACSRLNIPVKVRCGGTSLTGASVAAPESVVLLTGHLRQITFYNKQKGTVVTEPGVTPNQLNDYVSEEGWYFPLEMASNGIAGLAGCLSCRAKGYHQTGRSFYQAVKSITIIDGEGQQRIVPSALICGLEGLLGVIISLEIQLIRRPALQKQISCSLSWQQLLQEWPSLKQYQAIVGLIWQKDQFIFYLEGDPWRVYPAYHYLSSLCPVNEISLSPFFPFLSSGKQPFAFISSACPLAALPQGIKEAEERRKQIGLNCLTWADGWTGALHLVLSSDDSPYEFSKKLEIFFILWIEWLESIKGFILSLHGIGKLLRPYLPAFWGEEDRRFLKSLQSSFDPQGLFEKDHFFPVPGKSVEKRYHG